jgi:hypothetical protein
VPIQNRDAAQTVENAMNRWTRIAAAPALALALTPALVACGTTRDGSSGRSEYPAPAKAAPAVAPVAAKAAPKGTSLGDLVSIGSAEIPRRGAIKIATKIHDSAVYASFGCGNATAWEFDLDREYKQLTATIGLDDYSVTSDEAHVKVMVDDRVVSDNTVKFGQEQQISVDVTNGLRLRVEASRNSTTCNPTTGYSSNVALADPTLTK